MKKIILIFCIFACALPSFAIDDLSKSKTEEKFSDKLGSCSKYKAVSIGWYEYPNEKGKYIRAKQETKYIIREIENNKCAVDVVWHDKTYFMYKSKTCRFPVEHLGIFSAYFKEKGMQEAIYMLDDMYCEQSHVEW